MKKKEYIKPVAAETEMHNLSMLCGSDIQNFSINDQYSEADQLANENAWDIW